MLRKIVIALSLVALVGGCETRREADLQAHAAYMAGQQQAAKQWQLKRPPEVIVQGAVRYPVVPWEENLTLAKAIVTADYTAFMNPRFVRVIRNGLMIQELKGVDLLHGQDLPLQPGDIIVLVP